MNVTYPPRKPDQNSSQQSAQDGVQCWHVAVVVALLVAILVAILILVPIYTLNNTGGGGTPDVIGHSDLDMDSTFGNDLFTDVDSFDYVEPFENFQMVTNQSLNFTERLALNIINNLIKSGKVEFVSDLNSSSKTSLPCNNTCTSKIITCAQRLVVTDAGGGVKSTDLSNRLREGSAIAIRGKLKANTQRFVVDLLISNGKALHLNPRLRYFSDTNVMVVNSFLNNVWGYENRHTTAFPFTAGKFFEIVIRCNATAFNITSNGLSITFDYRVGVQLKNIVSMQLENMEVIDVMLM